VVAALGHGRGLHASTSNQTSPNQGCIEPTNPYHPPNIEVRTRQDNTPSTYWDNTPATDCDWALDNLRVGMLAAPDHSGEYWTNDASGYVHGTLTLAKDLDPPIIFVLLHDDGDDETPTR